jgi:hypothetical protein
MAKPAAREGELPSDISRLRVLRSVRVNPEWLAFAAIHAEMQSLQFGCDEGERRDVAIFVREHDILFALDLDRAHSRTEDGRPREFRYRCSVNVDADVGGEARSVGVVLNLAQLRGYLRKKNPNNGRFTVLDGDLPLTLEIRGPLDEERATHVVLYPPVEPGKKAKAPRVIAVRRPASLDDFAEVEPLAADRGLIGFRGEDAIELGALADPAVGALVMPDPGWLVAYHPDRIAASRFTRPAGMERDRGQLAISLGTADGESAAQRALSEETVVPGRLLIAGGFAQLGFESYLTESANQQVRRHQDSSYAAAMAAVMDVVDNGPGAVLSEAYAAVGRKRAHEAMQQAQGVGAAERERRGAEFGRSLLEGHSAEERLAVVASMEAELADSRRPAPDEPALRSAAEGDIAVEAVARLYLAVGERVEPLLDAASRAVGDLRVRAAQEGQRKSAAMGGFAPNAELSASAIELLGKEAPGFIGTLLPKIPAEAHGPWWTAYGDYLRTLDVPRDLAEKLTHKGRGRPAPGAGDLRLPDKTWSDGFRVNSRAAGQGCLWRGEDGRVYVGMQDERFGRMMISDLPVQPDPRLFPLSPAELARLTGKVMDGSRWRGEFWRGDFQWMANRIVGAIDPVADDPQNLWVMRWEPEGAPSAASRVLQGFPTIESKTAATPESGYVDGRELRSVRGPSTPAADPAQAGRLSVFVFAEGGERLYLRVPMAAIPEAGSTGAFAVAMNAERLHDLAAITGRSKRVLLDVGRHTVRIADPSGRVVVALPTVSRSEIPHRYRDAFLAAGVADLAESVTRQHLFGRAQDLIERARIADQQAARAAHRAPEAVVTPRGPSVVWPRTRAMHGLKTQIGRLESELRRIEVLALDLFASERPDLMMEVGRARELRASIESKRAELDALEAAEAARARPGHNAPARPAAPAGVAR